MCHRTRKYLSGVVNVYFPSHVKLDSNKATLINACCDVATVMNTRAGDKKCGKKSKLRATQQPTWSSGKRMREMCGRTR